MAINIIERAITPYNASPNGIVKKEQYGLYAPAANINKVGMAGYNAHDFAVGNQIVSISNQFKSSMIQHVDVNNIPSNIVYLGADDIKTAGVMYVGFTHQVVNLMSADDIPTYATVTGTLLVTLSEFIDTTNYSLTELFMANGREWTRKLEIEDNAVTDITEFLPLGIAGKQGPVGPAAGFGKPIISITQLLHTQAPYANITTWGENTSKVFAFDFGIPASKPFSIRYIVENVTDLMTKTDAVLGDFAIIQSTEGAQEEQNAQLFVCLVNGGTNWQYLSDLSGANGLSLLRTTIELSREGGTVSTNVLTGTPMIGDSLIDPTGLLCGVIAVDNDIVTYEYYASLAGIPGRQMFIKFSAYSDGSNYTDTWTSNQAYIGLYFGDEEPADKTGYQWIQFVGNYVETTMDTTSTDIRYTLQNNVDKTFAADDILYLRVTVPDTVDHGFCAGVNLKVSELPPAVLFTNNSAYPLKLMQFGAGIPNYLPNPNCTACFSIFCDGLNVYCYINEV